LSHALDTNVVIDVINGRRPVVRERWRAAISAGAVLTLSAVAVFELWYGVSRAKHQRENAERLRIFLSGDVDVVQFAEEDAIVAGELRGSLASAGTPIGPYDLLIAAQALRSGAILVTANTSEFARVPGLRLEDWTQKG
jgi:tRNA(fMet)-specific endonuclease VapC